MQAIDRANRLNLVCPLTFRISFSSLIV